MSNYKNTQLGIQESERWRGGDKEYHYILPKNKRELNYLDPYRSMTDSYVRDENIKLHQFFHHLNSSQAMCLNFFYPLIAEDCLYLLLKALQIPVEPIVEYAFKHIMPGGERTNFDFYMKLASGKELLFEIKYTEKGFSKVSVSINRHQQYEKVSRQLLAGKIRPEISEYESLVKNYQLLRNIAHVEIGGNRLVVFICLEHNLKLHKEYKNLMDNIVVPGLQNHVQMCTWEAVLAEMKRQVNMPGVPVKLRDLYKEFGEKYLVI